MSHSGGQLEINWVTQTFQLHVLLIRIATNKEWLIITTRKKIYWASQILNPVRHKIKFKATRFNVTLPTFLQMYIPISKAVGNHFPERKWGGGHNRNYPVVGLVQWFLNYLVQLPYPFLLNWEFTQFTHCLKLELITTDSKLMKWRLIDSLFYVY